VYYFVQLRHHDVKFATQTPPPLDSHILLKIVMQLMLFLY